MKKLNIFLMVFIILNVIYLNVWVMVFFNKTADNKPHVGAIDYSIAMEYITRFEIGHQNVVDHPDLIQGDNANPLLGDVQFHADCVTEYQQLREFIERQQKLIEGTR